MWLPLLSFCYFVSGAPLPPQWPPELTIEIEPFFSFSHSYSRAQYQIHVSTTPPDPSMLPDPWLLMDRQIYYNCKKVKTTLRLFLNLFSKSQPPGIGFQIKDLVAYLNLTNPSHLAAKTCSQPSSAKQPTLEPQHLGVNPFWYKNKKLFQTQN